MVERGESRSGWKAFLSRKDSQRLGKVVEGSKTLASY